MRRIWLVIGVFALLAVMVGLPSSSAGTSPTTGWGKAIAVPGTGALNSKGDAGVASISCTGARECAAGGYYLDGSNHHQAYVAARKNGVWGAAVQVPGSAALNVGGNAEILSVSCAAAGECAAGGVYTDGSGHSQALVASEKKGVWGNAVEVPGMAALNKGDGEVTAVSCGAPGDCAAVGYYADNIGHFQAFLASEKKGVWGNAVKVPGTAALNVGGAGGAGAFAVSCTAAGECAVGGNYQDGAGRFQTFVVSEKKGVWGTATEAPGTGTLNAGGIASLDTISCAAPGECAAGGYYRDGAPHFEAFVLSEKKGVWGAAVKVPGTAALNKGDNANIAAISCPAPGECAAGGSYLDGTSHGQAFVVSQKKGVWGAAIQVPGTAKLNRNYAAVTSVACGAVGDCVAGGTYTGFSGHREAFLVSDRAGRWSGAIKVPGTGALNVGGYGGLFALSCGAPGQCDAGGTYADGVVGVQAFVVHGATPCIVPRLVGKTVSAAKKALAGAKCRVGRITQVRSHARAGLVVAQHPKPGTSLSPGSKVALTVSKGP